MRQGHVDLFVEPTPLPSPTLRLSPGNGLGDKGVQPGNSGDKDGLDGLVVRRSPSEWNPPDFRSSHRSVHQGQKIGASMTARGNQDEQRAF